MIGGWFTRRAPVALGLMVAACATRGFNAAEEGASADLSARAGQRAQETVIAGLPRGLVMRIDDAGGVHAAMIRHVAPADRVLYLSRKSGDAAFTVEQIAVGSRFLEGTGLALDPSGQPHVAFFDHGTIKVARRSAGTSTWVIDVVDPDVGVSLINPSPEVVIGHDGTEHVTYAAFVTPPSDSSHGAVKYATRAPGDVFHTEVIDLGEVYDPGWVVETTGFASLALDGAGVPHVCYGQSRSLPPVTSVDDLKYATKTAAGWSIETVEKGGHRGGYCSLAFDRDGRPNISHLDSSTYDLRFASRQQDGTWAGSVIEQAGSVGRFSTLMFDGAGAAHVAYIDEGTGMLRLASSSDGQPWEIEPVADVHAFAGGDMTSALDPQGEAHFLVTRVASSSAALLYVH